MFLMLLTQIHQKTKDNNNGNNNGNNNNNTNDDDDDDSNNNHNNNNNHNSTYWLSGIAFDGMSCTFDCTQMNCTKTQQTRTFTQ